jgi:hypothetical protein
MGKQNESDEVKTISPLAPEWSDYVMSLFAEDELKDGKPFTAGLRRVAEMLVGEIISSKPTSVVHLQTKGPVGRTIVTYEIIFSCVKKDQLYTKTFADTAEVWEANTDDMFAVHAAATASTRAEGRALRKALKLRVVAAEELCKKDASAFLSQQTDQVNERITVDQINFIDMRCKKLDIDVIAFVNSGEKRYASINAIERETASKMTQRLTQFSNGAPIPKEIVGYKSEWRAKE